MLKESNISPKEIRSRSGPPRRLAATQEPDRNAVLKPASAVSLALIPSHTAGLTTRPGWLSTSRRRSGALFITIPLFQIGLSALLLQRVIIVLLGRVACTTLRAVSTPATGSPFGSSRPTCTSTDAWSQ